jgi:hypothetical protein
MKTVKLASMGGTGKATVEAASEAAALARIAFYTALRVSCTAP